MSQESLDSKLCPTNKKRKRISFSKNLMLQELLSDGSTRIFEEKINDKESCSLVSMEIDSINDSDSIFNKTVYDTCEMEMDMSTFQSLLPLPSLSPLPTQTPPQQLTPPREQNPVQSLTPSQQLSPSLYLKHDSLSDSVLIYIDEKSVLQLSSEDSTPEQSMIQYQSNTFVADLCHDDEDDTFEESVDYTLHFIDNRAPSPVKKMLNSASIDTRLWSFISEINEEYAILTFLQGNFKAFIKFDLLDDDVLDVNINEFIFQSLLDQKIQEKGWTPISDKAVYVFTKPRDAKIIKVIKKLANERFENYKKTIPTTAMLNDVLRGLCRIFNRLEALTVELAALSLRHEFKIVNADIKSFEFAVATYGVRHILWVVLCLDLTNYPDTQCKIKFGVHKADLKLYHYPSLNRAAKNITPGDGCYLRSIVRATKKFICDHRLKHARKAVRISFAPKRSMIYTGDK